MTDLTPSLSDLIQKAYTWLEIDPDPNTRKQIQNWIDTQDETSLVAAFGPRLHFGTAGLRGKIGPGPSQMNRALVRKVSYGLADYLSQKTGEDTPVMVIGYDGRHQSLEFAQETASVFLKQGYDVYLSSTVVPTPLLAFSVVHLNAIAGVMVTASHNPPQDNGFKVYWGNGAQIIPPHDSGISRCIDRVSVDTLPTDLNFETLQKSDSFHWIPSRVEDQYFKAILKPRILPQSPENLKVVYTAMHGVGYSSFKKAMDLCGYTACIPVQEQIQPDPLFPTVSFPNPEEKGALDLALKEAEAQQADLILAHDPDADRLAVVARDQGQLKSFTGDQVGALIAYDLFNHLDLKSDDLVASTIVSSSLLSKMAKEVGIQYAETLTGFKWIANRCLSHQSENKRFLFGYEEAIGYSMHGIVYDKDGVSAALYLADMAARAKEEGQTLWDKLNEVYRKYGLYLSSLKSRVRAGREGALEIQKWMHQLRQNPPQKIAGLKVVHFLDYDRLDDLLKGNVLRFQLEDQSRVIARPSGTEPKIKFYFEVCQPLNEILSLEEAQNQAQVRIQKLMQAWDELLK